MHTTIKGPKKRAIHLIEESVIVAFDKDLLGGAVTQNQFCQSVNRRPRRLSPQTLKHKYR